MAQGAGAQPWWELEPVPQRRTALPENKARMPSMQDMYKVVKHAMTVRFPSCRLLICAHRRMPSWRMWPPAALHAMAARPS
jgi:hypothetical protein